MNSKLRLNKRLTSNKGNAKNYKGDWSAMKNIKVRLWRPSVFTKMVEESEDLICFIKSKHWKEIKYKFRIWPHRRIWHFLRKRLKIGPSDIDTIILTWWEVICEANIFGIGGHVKAIANRFGTLWHDKWFISWNIGDDIERCERFDSDKSVWTTTVLAELILCEQLARNKAFSLSTIWIFSRPSIY